MKIRNGFVSNSSSSSYIVDTDLSSKGISCLKLNAEQKRLLQFSGYLKGKDLEKDFYLTEFLTSDDKYEKLRTVDHEEYVEGEMCGEPRCDEFFNEYNTDGRSVYLMREHDTAKQMWFVDFVKKYKNSGLPQEVIVRFESDGVKLLYVQ